MRQTFCSLPCYSPRLAGNLRALSSDMNSMQPIAMNRVAAPLMMQNARLLGQQRHAVLPMKVKPWPEHAHASIICNERAFPATVRSAYNEDCAALSGACAGLFMSMIGMQCVLTAGDEQNVSRIIYISFLVLASSKYVRYVGVCRLPQQGRTGERHVLKHMRWLRGTR